MLQRLSADFREFPGTMALCSAWVVVFVLMVLADLMGPGTISWDELLLGVRNGHRFGDMTLDDLARGEYWRLVTATFVHYGVLHIGMNLYGMYLLGTMIETWYGAGQFLALYGLMGGGGNLISWLARSGLNRWVATFPEGTAASELMRWLRQRLYSPTHIPSGGGSVVVLGLVALCAVVGWRSRTRFGQFLASQMLGVLIFTALLGQVIPIIDNWGHTGGAIVGAAIGLAHRTLIQTAHRAVAWWMGAVGTLLLVSCGAAQWRDDRTESLKLSQQLATIQRQLNENRQTLETLAEVQRLYDQATRQRVVRRGAFLPFGPKGPASKSAPEPPPESVSSWQESDQRAEADLKKAAALLQGLKGTLDTGNTSHGYRRLLELLSRPFADAPTIQEFNEFESRLQSILRVCQRERAATLERYEEVQHGSRSH
jgi:rhomboid protease GluP